MSIIDDVFKDGGILSKEISGYKPRPGQIAMSEAIHEALGQGRHIIAEGATGTGKSFAYLVPATHHVGTRVSIGKDKRRIVIVTANINLQEQLINKDLPFLHKVLPWHVSYALAKGTNNYLCRLVHEETKKPANLVKLRRKHGDKSVNELEDWAATTTTGDRSDLVNEPTHELWRNYGISSDDCLGRKKCSYAATCFAMKAKDKWWGSNVLVANYHLYFAHMNTGGNLLPDHDTVIFDEAHRMADIARDFFGDRFTYGSIRYASRHIPDSFQRESHLVVLEEFFQDLEKYAKSDRYRGYIGGHGELSKNIPNFEMSLESLEGLASLLAQQVPNIKDALKKERVVNAVGRLRLGAKFFSSMDADSSYGKYKVVYSIEKDGKYWSARSRVVDVGLLFREQLYPEKSVVLTSATLSTGGSFNYVRQELGFHAQDPVTEFVAASPFDLPRQVLFMVDQELPPPVPSMRHLHLQRSADQMIEVMRAVGGKTLALFTSKTGMEFTHRALTAQKDLPFTVLVQGQYTKPETIRRFKEDTTSVLLGLSSYWEGVDVPGEALSCLIIDKLPFPSPSDPLLAKICDENQNWFFEHSLPRAIITFRQGLGRLIRSVDDYGLLVFTDSRLITKNYGSRFLHELKGVNRISSIHQLPEAVAYLDGQRKKTP